MKRTLLIAAMAAFTLAHAPLGHAAGADDEKKVLVQRVLPLFHIEDAPVITVQQQGAEALRQANTALQGRLTGEKQTATMKSIAVDVQKYIDEATPIARNNALKLKEPTVAPILMENFTAEELRQLVAFFESPVKKKFEALLPTIQKTYGEKVAEASRGAIDPKIKTMSNDVATKMRAAVMTSQ
jgi:hypothetical protein